MTPLQSPQNCATLNPQPLGEGVLYMSRWGKVVDDPDRGVWAVCGIWERKRLYFSKIPKADGDFITCKSRELAEILQDDISREMARGTFLSERYRQSKPLHFKRFSSDWLEIRKPNISHRAYITYRSYIKHLAYFNADYLPDINYKKIQMFFNQLDLNINTKSQVQTCLRAILNDAMRSGYIKQLPPRIKFDIPRRALSWMTRTDQEAILNEIPARHRPIFQFIMATGVRPSEARALQKRDVKEDHIILRHSFTVGQGGEVLSTIKTKREEAIPLYESARNVIEQVKKYPSPFVFVNPDIESHYRKDMGTRIWNPACVRAIGKVFPLNHAGRHSFANQLLSAGVDMETVSRALRHSSTAMTKAHYARPDMGIIKGLVDGVQK